MGVDEFMRWCAKAGVEPMMALNLGTRGVAEALDLLEYCNVAGGSTWSDQRRKNGAEEPHGIRMWCLGNEMDGPWQTGHKTASEYGRLAAETARAMRQIQPDLELVACGSSSSAMPTFGEWERDGAHRGLRPGRLHLRARLLLGSPTGTWPASSVPRSTWTGSSSPSSRPRTRCGRPGGTTKRIHISFDEWNVWYLARGRVGAAEGLLAGRAGAAGGPLLRWRTPWWSGNLLISLLRHTDRVHAASLAQLVNVIAPIMTEPGGRDVEADDLPPLRAHLPACRRRRARRADRHPVAPDGEVR